MSKGKDKEPPEENKDIESQRLRKKKKILQLSDYKNDYNVEKFILDLENYFDCQVDFNLEKIRQTILSPGKLNQLIRKAKENNTHPVTEFLADLFKSLGTNRK